MTEDTRKQYTNYREWVIERGDRENHILNGVSSAHYLIQDISRRYKKIECDYEKGNITVDDIPLKQKESLKRKLKMCGYFISSEKIHNDSKTLSVVIKPSYSDKLI